jgi:putative Ca2+/H+ antiporter (TMEM165/GDT1 family)
MRRTLPSTILAFAVGTLFIITAVTVSAQDKPTGLRDARAANRGELIGSAVLLVIGIALIVLAPAKGSVEPLSAPVT